MPPALDYIDVSRPTNIPGRPKLYRAFLACVANTSIPRRHPDRLISAWEVGADEYGLQCQGWNTDLLELAFTFSRCSLRARSSALAIR